MLQTYNAKINDIKKQTKYFYKALNNYNYFLTEFHKRMENINSMSELIKEFEEIVMDETNIIRIGSTIALKHFAIGKYLTSIKDLCYTTAGSMSFSFFIL